jgi:hypothetical protein
VAYLKPIFLSLGRSKEFKSQAIILQQNDFSRWWAASHMSKPKAGGQRLVGCPQQILQYLCGCPPYLEAFFSFRTLKTRHAAMTRDALNMGCIMINEVKAKWKHIKIILKN